MPSAPTEQDENEKLAMKYRPLLVLYPEIKDGTRRKDNISHSDHKVGSKPPLNQDYHPRDIRFILDNAYLPGSNKKPTRDQLLDAMSENTIDYIDLVDRHGPRDVDKFWRVYADIEKKESNSEYKKKAYARVVRGSERFEEYISIQYWLAYFFDDWANVHEMDWEGASIILKKSGLSEEPVACVCNAHVTSFRKPWDEVEKVSDDNIENRHLEGTHPVIYVANGSHASYFSDYPASFNVVEKYLKDQLKTVIRLVGIGIGSDFTDFVPSFEAGKKCLPEVEIIPQPDEDGKWSGEWRWLNFRGKWGSPAKLSFKERLIPNIPLLRRLLTIFERPIREGGPSGPNNRPDLGWKSPIDWVNLECLDAEENRDWLREHKSWTKIQRSINKLLG